MTDKEFKRLSRSQLIEIIYQLQLKLEEKTAENDKLSEELADKRLRISDAGNLAEAALAIHRVMEAAQDAAAHYREEMRIRCDEEYQQILKTARDEADAMIRRAQQEAAEMAPQENNEKPDIDEVSEPVAQEEPNSPLDSGESK